MKILIMIITVLLSLPAYAETQRLTPRYYIGIGASLMTMQSRYGYICFDKQNGKAVRYHTEKKTGVKVGGVHAGSPAEMVGLACGDIITAVDGRAVKEDDEVIEMIRAKPPGTEFTVSFLRPAIPHYSEDTASESVLVPVQEQEVRVSSVVLDRILWPNSRGPTIGSGTGSSSKNAAGKWVTLNYVDTESHYWEISPDVMRYRCTIQNTGLQRLQHIKSDYFTIFKRPRGEIRIQRSKEKIVFQFDASIDRSGIPFESQVPFQYSAQWSKKNIRQYANQMKGVVFLREGDDWYLWQGTQASCWLPESLKLRLDKIVEHKNPRR